MLRFSDYQILNDIENVIRVIEEYIDCFKKKMDILRHNHRLLGKLRLVRRLSSSPLTRGEARQGRAGVCLKSFLFF